MPSNGEIIRRNDNRDENGNHNELVVSDFQPSEPIEPQAANPLLTIHYLLRGRYRLLLPLAIACALLVALPLHHAVHDKYSSTGTLRVQPTLPRVLQETVENGPLPMYQGFMELVTMLLTSEQVIDKAVSDPRWEAVAGPASPDTAASLLGKLRVMHEPSSEMITLTYTDTQSKAATTPLAVRVVFEAYLKLYSQNDEATRKQTIQTLEDLNLQQSDELKKLDQKSLDIARKYGAADLDRQVQQKMVDLSNLKDEYTKVELMLAAAQTNPLAATRPSDQPFSPEVWALSDNEMARLLEQRRAAKMAVRDKELSLGENNPSLLAARMDLQDLDHDIEDRAQFLSVNVQGAGGPGVVGNGATGAGIVGSGNIQTLRNQENALNKLLRNAQEELDELGRDNIALKDVVNKEADIHRRSAETKQRLEELKVEAAGTGRIDVISYGDRPVLETHKGNVIALAGGVAGAALAVGGMVLFELVNRRMRGIQDVQTGGDASTRLKVLGAVPMLGDDTPESDHTAAAYAVHKIRATLQIDAARFGRKVLAVTSPASGNGKTSVVIALGMSFASSRSRILLVDGDLIGGGLTSRLNGRVQRNIVDILRRCTIVTEKQLTHAAKIANQNTSRFLEALVDLKYVDRETITEAVAIHKASDIGVLEALAGEPLGTCVAQTRWPNLFILPRGAATPADAAELSPMAFRQLLHQARNLFDMVLIDTGPIFGSIEATMAASEADGTILVVSKGESAGAVCRAVKDLNMLGAKTIGAIFNRAKPKDMIFGGFSASSYQSQAFSPSAARSNIGHGPIANAIISASSAAREIPDIENDGSL